MILPDKATLYLCGIEDFEYKNEKINGFCLANIWVLSLGERVRL